MPGPANRGNSSERPRHDFFHDFVGTGVDPLHARIGPFLLRREKTNVLSELPPKLIVDVPCELSKCQRARYARFASREQASLTAAASTLALPLRDVSSPGTSASALRALLFERLLCVHPALVRAHNVDSSSRRPQRRAALVRPATAPRRECRPAWIPAAAAGPYAAQGGAARTARMPRPRRRAPLLPRGRGRRRPARRPRGRGRRPRRGPRRDPGARRGPARRAGPDLARRLGALPRRRRSVRGHSLRRRRGAARTRNSMMMSRESGSLADVQAVTVGVRIKPDLRSL